MDIDLAMATLPPLRGSRMNTLRLCLALQGIAIVILGIALTLHLITHLRKEDR